MKRRFKVEIWVEEIAEEKRWSPMGKKWFPSRNESVLFQVILPEEEINIRKVMQVCVEGERNGKKGTKSPSQETG